MTKRLGQILRRMADTGLELLFPKRCPLCDEPVGMGRKGFCDNCRRKLKPIGDRGCIKCGKLPEDIEEDFCRDCRTKMHYFVEGRSLYPYPMIAPAVYRFKYSGRREYAGAFAEEMCRELGQTVKNWHADGIVPVPLHKKRLRKRGYNQAGLLAGEIGRRLNLPVYDHLVQRCRDTVPQKELNAAERQNNLKKAFKMSQNDVKLSTIIIVDDIYTTGQTVDEISQVLLDGGAERVYVLTLASGAR